jgi:cyclic beta-1,2-glucan glucanotransferase
VSTHLLDTPSPVEQPIRAEVFGTERLEQHAASLAAAQVVSEKPPFERDLLPRLHENGTLLRTAYRDIVEAVREKFEITPAEEWLLDNFHVVDGQLREIRDHLPGSYYRLLPKIAAGHLRGYPRVYGLAWAYVAHTDSRFELETLQRFVRAYQRVQPLTIGELWAVAIHLRVALIENLRRLSEQAIRARWARAKADEVADRLLGLSGRPPVPTKIVLNQLGEAPLSAAFAVELVQRLRDQSPAVIPVLAWLENKLSVQGTSTHEVVTQEHQLQAAANVTVRNIITSMRWMSSIDWLEFFEGVSLVDLVLHAAPGFAAMDFATRDDYRGEVELLSRGSKRSEIDVAGEAVRLAREGAEPVATAARIPERAEDDPGYFLFSRGRKAFEKHLEFRPPWRLRLQNAFRAHAFLGYLGGISMLTALLVAVLPIWMAAAGSGVGITVFLALLALVPASEIAVALFNRLVPVLVPPRALPKLELALGVPPELRTMVVVPTLLRNQSGIQEQVDRLEVHYLSNPEGHLHFALLTDWADAPEEHMPDDESLLGKLAEEIASLNKRYEGPQEGGERFLLLHRRRLWNEREGKWMGWERKRGKLHELNRLLRGATDTTFLPVNGEPPHVPAGVRYVITLDADTRLPKGAAYRLVGAMAHPLNRPRFDPESGRVVLGYGVLQPRITASLPTGPRSTPYQRIVSGPGGVDPYEAAISDVYQDLFEEGTYTGKGVYDVDAFAAALRDKVPENALLSHDLFEGLFARSGLLTDVELFEEFPSNYRVASHRDHRWVRGDWQLLPWILGHARDAAGKRQKATIPVQGRWKMVDNLRRSVVAPCSFLLLVAAWVTGDSPLVLSGLVVGSIAVPAFLPVLDGLFPHRRGFSKRSLLRAVSEDLFLAFSKTFLSLTMLAHQAWLRTDAVLSTLGRLYITKRHLLEWVTAAQRGREAELRLRSFYWDLKESVLLALATGALILVLEPQSWPAATPFVLLWMLAPLIAWRLSLPGGVVPVQILSAAETHALRLLARRTWRFFETFVDKEGHSLPPDNFQEDPSPVVALRTSPTNMGLYLLSTIIAHDFGWNGILDTVERLETTLESMTSLRRFNGHFFNWYDIRSQSPLDPRYVSTVDSGNLAGHLIALAQACRQLRERPSFGPEVLEGIQDALDLLLEAVGRATHLDRAQTFTAAQLREAAARTEALLVNPPTSGIAWAERLGELETQSETLLDIAGTLSSDASVGPRAEVLVWAKAIRASVVSHVRDLQGLSDPTIIEHRLSALALLAEQMVGAMDFRFLFDGSRKLFSIGYRVADRALDPSTYDLLASEARLASFVAIAKGDVAPRHWFLLGRHLTPVGRGAALVSWSGSMFEYLMPLLVMRQPAGSLLDLTCRLVVGRQIRYGAERGVPWGVSESGYNIRDVELTYQYSDFGVPGLGLKRGLFEDVVVAPYATALAAMLDPKAALENVGRLEGAGARGAYGFYEALDYTPSRLPEKSKVALVRAYMAHHQGMILVSLGNVLHQGRTRARFHSHPMVQATELLLQERTPRSVAVTRPPSEEVRGTAVVRDFIPPTLRHFESPHDITPRTHLLSNGRYTVMITAAGAGFSRWDDLALTRWREDTTRDAWGTFFFLRDVATEEVWSAGFQPSGAEADLYEAVYSEDRAKITQQDRSLSIALEVIVSPEDDAELRQLTLTNRERRPRQIDVTSYAEVVLATQRADEAHPTFSNLFVETEFVPEIGALLATRRPRSAEDRSVWLAHVAMVDGETVDALQYESDRARFMGRGRGIRTPLSVIDGGPLSNTAGRVLDPIVSLRQRVVIPSGGVVRLVFTTLVAPSREEALEVAEKYGQPATFERESSLAWTQAQIQLHHLRISRDEAHLFQRLANRLLYADPTLRGAPDVIARNHRGLPGLWSYGISGDLPIALVRIERDEEGDIVRQLLRAYEYWHLKGLSADLIILNAKRPSYTSELQDALQALARVSQAALGRENRRKHGRVFVLRDDLVPEGDRLLLMAAARLVILAAGGTLSEQVIRLSQSRPGPVPPRRRALPETSEVVSPPALQLDFFNGLGGFTPDGREYVIVLGKGQWTPAPWINVVANRGFGFQVSESGSGYTWAANSRENKLTPWSNDPVSDSPGEMFYVWDRDNGQVWGPTPLPVREEPWPYVIRHGQGYSRFEHTSHDIAMDLVQCVPLRDPVKISRLVLENRSDRKRRLRITAYVEWVLGAERGRTAAFVITQIDPTTGAMLARNPWNGEFADRIAFADLGAEQTSWTGDRVEFLGRNASLDHPASLERGRELSGKTGAGLDPCAALQRDIELEPGEQAEVLFLLGQGANLEEVQSLVMRYRETDVDAVLLEIKEHWDEVLGAVQVNTPEPSLNLLLNRWLLYQTLSCRIWARSAFYQSGGAFGFRDQLQDVLALTLAKPQWVREHILRSVARQFPEGDVQHWWHPPTGRGVRTRISDDRLWLCYAVTQYLRVTGDGTLLDEPVPWIEGPLLEDGQQEAYFEPRESETKSTVFEHCVRALDRSLAVGVHGLPLMGAGDWNDGMNRVGHEGRGESVWLAWFLIVNLREFARLAELRGDTDHATSWREKVTSLQSALEAEAWDGEWYRRAFFDDGTPLGSAQNDACQIDSIAQSWAVLSEAANEERARRAMESVEHRLLRREDRLLLLFSPPFDRSPLDPGYIQGYLPGIRENGGQYTHAAVWSLVAFAELGEGGKALEIFNLLNPVLLAGRRATVHRYKVEPYVVSGDVYSTPPHVGRGGWTWYTGAAGWLYRAGLEWILGFQKQGDFLVVDPCIPKAWKQFEMTYWHGSTVYVIAVENPKGLSQGVSSISLDGRGLEGDLRVPLSPDGGKHLVRVMLG